MAQVAAIALTKMLAAGASTAAAAATATGSTIAASSALTLGKAATFTLANSAVVGNTLLAAGSTALGIHSNNQQVKSQESFLNRQQEQEQIALRDREVARRQAVVDALSTRLVAGGAGGTLPSLQAAEADVRSAGLDTATDQASVAAQNATNDAALGILRRQAGIDSALSLISLGAGISRRGV